MLDKEFKMEEEIIYVVYNNLFLKIYLDQLSKTIATSSQLSFLFFV